MRSLGSLYSFWAISTAPRRLIQQLWVVGKWAGSLANMTLLTHRREHSSIAIERLFEGREAAEIAIMRLSGNPVLSVNPVAYSNHLNSNPGITLRVQYGLQIQYNTIQWKPLTCWLSKEDLFTRRTYPDTSPRTLTHIRNYSHDSASNLKLLRFRILTAWPRPMLSWLMFLRFPFTIFTNSLLLSALLILLPLLLLFLSLLLLRYCCFYYFY